MAYFYIAVAAIGPILLILAGKRFLGSQTHPAAIFILSWILCSFILTLAEAIPASRGIIAFVWVSICYATIMIIREFQNPSTNSSSEGSSESSAGQLSSQDKS